MGQLSKPPWISKFPGSLVRPRHFSSPSKALTGFAPGGAASLKPKLGTTEIRPLPRPSGVGSGPGPPDATNRKRGWTTLIFRSKPRARPSAAALVRGTDKTGARHKQPEARAGKPQMGARHNGKSDCPDPQTGAAKTLSAGPASHWEAPGRERQSGRSGKAASHQAWVTWSPCSNCFAGNSPFSHLIATVSGANRPKCRSLTCSYKGTKIPKLSRGQLQVPICTQSPQLDTAPPTSNPQPRS